MAKFQVCHVRRTKIGILNGPDQSTDFAGVFQKSGLHFIKFWLRTLRHEKSFILRNSWYIYLTFRKKIYDLGVWIAY